MAGLILMSGCAAEMLVRYASASESTVFIEKPKNRVVGLIYPVLDNRLAINPLAQQAWIRSLRPRHQQGM